MPRYVYRCKECEKEFQKSHSIKEKLKDCELCSSKDSLMRLPGGFTTKFKVQKQKPGSLVNEFIKDAHEDLKDQKDEMEKKR